MFHFKHIESRRVLRRFYSRRDASRFHDNMTGKLNSQTITVHGSYNAGLTKNVKIFCNLSV